MHQNPAFRGAPREAILAFAAERGFGALSAADGDAAPLVAHAPFVLIEAGAAAELHLMRANPVLQALKSGPRAARLAVMGPDAYVSPDWYGLGPDQVPTWNYVAAHLIGRLERLPDDALRVHLDRLSAAFEARLAPKPPWRVDKMTPEAYARLARGIAPVRLAIETVEGAWKLNQNKPADGRRAAAARVAGSAIGSSAAAEIAALMRGLDAPEGDAP